MAKAQFEDSLDVEQWTEAAASCRSLDQPDLVISCLKDMKPAEAHAEEEIRKLIGYLDNNRARLGQAKRREEGLTIGSGGVESANKYISHARQKRSGARWLIPNGNNMLRLRCVLNNETCARAETGYRRQASTTSTFRDKLVTLPAEILHVVSGEANWRPSIKSI